LVICTAIKSGKGAASNLKSQITKGKLLGLVQPYYEIDPPVDNPTYLP
jgi:hypothetical protein